MFIRPSTLRFGLLIGLAAALAGCKSHGLDETGGVTITRSVCPAVALPAYTGDVTLFNPPMMRDASAIDVVATLTDLRGACNDVPPADHALLGEDRHRRADVLGSADLDPGDLVVRAARRDVLEVGGVRDHVVHGPAGQVRRRGPLLGGHLLEQGQEVGDRAPPGVDVAVQGLRSTHPPDPSEGSTPLPRIRGERPRQRKAAWPVIAWPTTRVCISTVPS